MTSFDQVRELIPTMSSQEKLRLIGLLAEELSAGFPGIERTPGICGGSARIAGSRIPVWSVVSYKQLGASDAELLQAFPTIGADDLSNALAYYRTNREEIDGEIRANEAA